MTKDELLRHLNLFYTQFLNYRDVEKNVIQTFIKLKLNHFFIKYLCEKYEIKEVAVEKYREIITSTLKYHSQDTRIMHFGLFLGLVEGKITNEAIFIYAKLLKVSECPLDIAFGKNYNVPIEFEVVCRMMKKYIYNKF